MKRTYTPQELRGIRLAVVLTTVALLAALLLTFFFARMRPARAAEASLVQPATQRLHVGSLAVQVFGSGKQRLVLIAGLGSGTWTWRTTIARFAPTYRIYALTLPGFDGQPASAKRPLIGAFTRNFWRFLAQQKVEKPIVIGHSLGGTLAILLAEQHPKRLRAIIAVDGLPVFPGTERVTPVQRKARAAAMTGMMSHETKAQFDAGNLRFMQHIGVIDPTLAAMLATKSDRSDPASVAEWASEDLGLDLRPQLGAIGIPILEIEPYNPPDAATPPLQYTQAQGIAYYRSFFTGAPQITVESIAPARHFVMFDQPQQFFATLERFLATLR